MSPLLACFPVCMMFVAIGILGVVILAFGLGNRIPGDDELQTAITPRDPNQKMGPPPWWVFPLMLLAVTLLMLVFAWCWPE